MQSVGAAEVLRPAHGCALAADLSAPPAALAAAVEAALADADALRGVAAAAQRAVLAHDEAGNSAHMTRVLDAVLATAAPRAADEL